jgi:hypothetical protein
LFEVQRPQIWPEDLDTQTKLWGTEADLRATAQFIASIDLDTQTKLWGTEADLRATAQFVASTDLKVLSSNAKEKKWF